MEKCCTKCGETKPLHLFKKTKQNATGYGSWCKACHCRDTVARTKKDRTKANRNSKKYRNSIHGRAYRRHWKKKRKITIKEQTPAWADPKKIKEIYEECVRRGPDMTVDHIVPIHSDLVCGLHCEDNLQIIDELTNSTKGNRWWPGMPRENEGD